MIASGVEIVTKLDTISSCKISQLYQILEIHTSILGLNI